MMHGLLAVVLVVTLRVLSARKVVRRHMPGFEGRSVSLRLRGDRKPFVLVVRDRRFVLSGDAKPDAEIEGDLGTFIELLLGRLDYDAAFFRRRISFAGDLPTAMRFKALFDHMTL